MRPSIRLLFLLFIAFASQGLTQELPGRLNVWMNAEQNLNDKNGFNIPTRDHSALQKQFQAVSGSWFQVKSYWIPESELDVASIVDQVSPELKDSLIKVIDGISHYRLFVHPESESFYDSLTKKYPAAESALARATASSRTVLMTTENGDFFFAKLSLNVELGRVVRTIPKAETVQSIGLSQYILNKKNQIDSGFHFIPETLGIIPKGWARGGQIIRPIPKEVLSGEKTIVPLFALTAPQKNGTLLAQMIQQSGDNPYQFVRHQILKPFVKSWVQWAIHGALSMEAHSQNVLLEISKKGIPTGIFYHRDMGGMNLDLSSPVVQIEEKNKLPYFSSVENDYHQNFVAEARETSLSVYFSERFLYNVDRVLTKIDPGYKSGTLQEDLWKELQIELKLVTGLSSSRITIAKLRNQLPQVLSESLRAAQTRKFTVLQCGHLF